MTTGMMAILVSLMLTGKSGVVTNAYYNYSITTNGTVRDYTYVTEFTDSILPTQFKDYNEVYLVDTFVNGGYMYEVYQHGFGGIKVASGTEKESHNLYCQGGDYSIKG